MFCHGPNLPTQEPTMSKLIDRILADAIFKEQKVVKVEKPSKIEKALMEKLQEQLLEDLKKKLEKKEEKKEEKKGWEALSVFQKFAVLWITVPMLLFLQFSVMLKFAIVLGLVKTW